MSARKSADAFGIEWRETYARQYAILGGSSGFVALALVTIAFFVTAPFSALTLCAGALFQVVLARTAFRRRRDLLNAVDLLRRSAATPQQEKGR